MFGSDAFLRALRDRTTPPAAPLEASVPRPNGPPLRLCVAPDAGVGGCVWEAATALADWLAVR